MNRSILILLSILAVLAAPVAAQDLSAPGRIDTSELSLENERSRIRPLFDTTIRDTSICRGGDGRWYLTGTYAPDGDFQNNDGITLWHSPDFETWEKLGQVWSITRDATSPHSAWQLERRVNPDDPRGPLVRGMVSPEIRHLRGTYWLTYSMNGRGTGLLKSRTGKPEGPYVDFGRITGDGSDASLFEDEDGTVYWVVGQGWIARMSPDLTGLAEPLRLIRPKPFPAIKHGDHTMSATHAPRTVGLAGAHLFRSGGRYWLAAATVRDRIGVGCYDTCIAGADSLEALFDTPMMMIPHGGQTTVFDGPGGVLYATFSGRDSRAAFQDRPAALPLVSSGEVLYQRGPIPPFPRRKFGIMTEFGPWAEVGRVAPYHIRDLQFMRDPDGVYYLTGSGTDAAYAERIMLFRSTNLRDWEPVEVQFDFLGIPGVTEADRGARFDPPRHRENLTAKYMDSEIIHAGGTYHIFTTLYGRPLKADGTESFGGPMWLRSTSGKAEGPYEYVDRAYSQPSPFVDVDGQAYLFYNGRIEPWDPNADALSRERFFLKTTMGTRFAKGDVATNLAVIHGKYIVFATSWSGGTIGENYRIDGTYDWVYWQADTLGGPYDMPRRAYPMPHAGHSCPPIRGDDGRWYGLFFGNDNTGPWWNYPGVSVYEVRLDPDDTVRIELVDELP